jgi:hypothetical protein
MATTDGDSILADRFRTGKAYTLRQAAKLASVSTQTARRWVLGYEESDRQGSPVFGPKSDEPTGAPLMLSFLELVELDVVAKFRKNAPSLKLANIREAHRFARAEWQLAYPFASAKLLAVGGHVLSDFARERGAERSEWLALDMQGSPSLPGLVRDELGNNLEYPDTFAGR